MVPPDKMTKGLDALLEPTVIKLAVWLLLVMANPAGKLKLDAGGGTTNRLPVRLIVPFAAAVGTEMVKLLTELLPMLAPLEPIVL